jgi:hypothetical protein
MELAPRLSVVVRSSPMVRVRECSNLLREWNVESVRRHSYPGQLTASQSWDSEQPLMPASLSPIGVQDREEKGPPGSVVTVLGLDSPSRNQSLTISTQTRSSEFKAKGNSQSRFKLAGMTGFTNAH